MGALSRTLWLVQAAAAAALLPGGPSGKPLVDEWNAPRAAPIPNLPLDAVVLEEADEAVWSDETLEFNGLRADPRTPRPLQAHLSSFRLPTGKCCHAFDGAGQSVSSFAWRGAPTASARPLPDRALVLLILELLDAVNYLHGRGSAYLGLDAEVVRIVNGGGGSSEFAAGDMQCGDDNCVANEVLMDDESEYRLRLIGFGAAVRLQSRPAVGAERRSTYMLDSEVAFHAPELLSSAVIQSNLRSLLQIDSWSVGVLIAMIAGGENASPFAASADWTAGLLTPEAATRSKIQSVQRELSDFLTELDANSGGFIFRHGWLVRLLLGLLQVDPAKRMTVNQAWSVARDSIAEDPRYAPAAAATAAAKAAPPKPAPEPPQRAPSEAKPRSPPSKKPSVSPQQQQNEMTRFRKMAATSPSGEPFRSLEAMLNIGSRGGAYVVMQKRPWPGIKNYGEVIGFRNRADGDRWDIFAPGLEDELAEGEPLKLSRVLGVVLIKGGNHKLCVELDGCEPSSKQQVATDVREFVSTYAKTHKGLQASRVRYLALDELDF